MGSSGPGVAPDIRSVGTASLELADRGIPEAFFSDRRAHAIGPVHLVQARASLGHAIAAVNAAVASSVPGLNGVLVRPRPEAEGLLVLRHITLAIGLTGAIVLLMALLGIYAVMGYAVLQRTRIIGIMTALGASPGQVYRETILQGLKLVALGLAPGLIIGMAVERLINPAFWGGRNLSVWSYAALTMAFLVAGWTASHGAGRKGASVDPAIALRL
jgi:hypothetical protein